MYEIWPPHGWCNHCDMINACDRFFRVVWDSATMPDRATSPDHLSSLRPSPHCKQVGTLKTESSTRYPNSQYCTGGGLIMLYDMQVIAYSEVYGVWPPRRRTQPPPSMHNKEAVTRYPNSHYYPGGKLLVLYQVQVIACDYQWDHWITYIIYYYTYYIHSSAGECLFVSCRSP